MTIGSYKLLLAPMDDLYVAGQEITGVDVCLAKNCGCRPRARCRLRSVRLSPFRVSDVVT